MVNNGRTPITVKNQENPPLDNSLSFGTMIGKSLNFNGWDYHGDS